ncbi:hypothetical protein SCORR_v1c01460 [Spiroplasma corruscae]|uniref:Uncharacterized protein n=1 Tax=Spiroplasma corruscae TaxID=216934 RepID=A0A222ENC2_9MOLU|nr:hypothetical protein [Spiroplasma corruscae]ASP27921.1 hypothetical protein SCORR_v1c01460 [Spiroplasma corruscae]
MSKNDKNAINFEELARQRLEEVKSSNKLMGVEEGIKNNYYIPKRKNEHSLDETKDLKTSKKGLIKPRKKKEIPISIEQKKELENTITLIKQEFKEKQKKEEKFEKHLLKERHKIEKMISKTSKRLNSLVKNEEIIDADEVEKTLELHDNFIKKIGKIDEDLNTLVLSNPGLTLNDRRKFIYKRAYKAETERARRLLEMKNKNKMNWSDQNYVEDKKGPTRGPEGWKERLGIEEDD